MRRWLQRHVLHNAGTKSIALGLAALLYLHVFTSQPTEIELEIPLALRGVPEGLTWSGDLPQHARVRLRGVGVDLLKLRSGLETAHVQVDVMEARPGHYQRPLIADDVVLSPALRVQALEVLSPHEITLDFDRVLVRRLAVLPTTTGRVAPGYTMHGRIVAEPDTVVVRGPAEGMTSSGHVKLEAVDLTGLSDMVTRRVRVAVPPDYDADPQEVTVRVMIEKVVSRTFTQLPVDVLRSRGVLLRRLSPETGAVVVSGPAGVVESLRPEELRASIDARGLPPGGVYTLMASVELRRGEAAGSVSIEPVQPEKFEVELE
jgi:hypothetical protein